MKQHKPSVFNKGKYEEVVNFTAETNDPALLLHSVRSYTELGQFDEVEPLFSAS